MPEGLEVFLVEADSVSVRDLVDEEILLRCRTWRGMRKEASARTAQMQLPDREVEAEEAADSQVQKPFAQLGELLKRK